MGNGPPTNIEASELYQRIANRKRPFKVVDFPSKDDDGKPIGQLAIWPLKQGEILAAKAGALETARKYVKTFEDSNVAAAILGDGYDQMFKDACACELIFRFARDEKDPKKPVFPTAKSVMSETKGLSSDECAVLCNQYADVQHELGPIVAWMSTDEMDAWLTRLGEGGRRDPLALLSSEQKNDLLLRSAVQLVKLQTVKDSSGLQQEEPTTEQTQE